MAPRIDRIAALLNCPTKGAEIRQAIKESRKDFLLTEDEEVPGGEVEGDSAEANDLPE
ncbi:hypothetical protein IF690_02000 [Pseudomonas sp. SK3(2021)]|uniref:hypothetical protein n=1 Tax=Pseudomonas sp. SK3(2021) TaxID=2841064 RepID=UPI00192C6532|nr:hypothetical protein [Pseudomonas sp. SK3(2021)]QQZ42334.1 hypothetical protein IF690_02000 [Pseudomonas sp. SK3(2021)]